MTSWWCSGAFSAMWPAPWWNSRDIPWRGDVEKMLRGAQDRTASQGQILDLGVRVLLTGLRHGRAPHPYEPEVAGSPGRDPDHQQCNPILEWTEMDIWAYTMEHGIPHCSLYDQGYRSLGCVPCTVAPDQGRWARRNAPGRFPGKGASTGSASKPRVFSDQGRLLEKLFYIRKIRAGSYMRLQ